MEAPLPTSPSKPTTTTSQGKKRLLKKFWDGIWYAKGDPKKGLRLWREFSIAIRRCKTILWIAALGGVSLVVTIWNQSFTNSTLLKSNSNLSKDKEFLKTAFMTVGASNGATITALQQQVGNLIKSESDKNLRIQELIQERDKAIVLQKEAEHSLAQWILLAQSQNTNTPLTAHMDSLNAAILLNSESLGRVLRDFERSRDKYSVSINGELFTNGIVSMHLDQNRSFRLAIHNVGESVIDKITVLFSARTSLTNIVYDFRWRSDKNWLVFPGAFNQNVRDWSTISFETDSSLPPNGIHHVTEFSFSTNLVEQCAARIDVITSRSSPVTIDAVLQFE